MFNYLLFIATVTVIEHQTLLIVGAKLSNSAAGEVGWKIDGLREELGGFEGEIDRLGGEAAN